MRLVLTWEDSTLYTDEQNVGYLYLEQGIFKYVVQCLHQGLNEINVLNWHQLIDIMSVLHNQ